MSCETCSSWLPPDRRPRTCGRHHRLCPFAAVPTGYAAAEHGEPTPHPSAAYLTTFDGATPIPAGERPCGFRTPAPPGNDGAP